MTPRDYLETVVRPTLNTIGLGGIPAEQQMVGTALQESGLRSRHQIGGGPAIGLDEMETATHDDCWTNYLRYHPVLAGKIRSLLPQIPAEVAPSAEDMRENDAYACAMARVKYLRDPAPIPTDLDGQAAFYKRVYNGPGKATAQEYIDNWRAVDADQLWPEG